MQSYRRGDNLEVFIEQYNFFHNIKKQTNSNVSIINSQSGMYFDTKHLFDGVKNNKLDLREYQILKIKFEHEALCQFTDILIGAICATFHEITGNEVIIDYHELKLNNIMNEFYELIAGLYIKCYIDLELDKEDFDKELDKNMKELFRNLFKIINQQAKCLENIYFSDDIIESKKQFGVEYINTAFQKLNKATNRDIKNIFINIFIKELQNILSSIVDNEVLSKEEAQFIINILLKYINDRRKIRKNDIVDYIIITALNSQSQVLLAKNSQLKNNALPNKINTTLITFDKVLFNYSKENNWLYDENVYNTFFTKQN